MSVTGDTILEQVEFTYDAGGNVIETVTRRRYHNAPASQTGELKNPSETPKARVTYSASYPDALGRTQAAVSYGTNGGSALSRSSTIPTGSDDVLVTQTAYDAAGNTASTTDASGMVTQFTYDDAGRETSRVMNPQASSSSSSSGGCSPSADENVTVETAYNADGNVSSITVKNASTGDQVTQYVYGTTLSDSAIASSALKRKEIYPDSTGDSDAILFEYNRQNQVTQQTDQGGTVHEYDYDKLGRQTHDRVTALDTGVDGAVRRISTEYEVRGMRETITSWGNATVGSGSIVNQVQFTYNDFGQLTTGYQSHSGAVNTSTTPKVQYGYANGSANTIRPTTLTYPDGRVLTYDYGSTDSMADALSRIESIVDDDVSSTHLVDYSYLGLSKFVETDYTEPDMEYTLVGTAGGNDPDTGDIYRGLDRFGRIKDSDWYDYGSAADVDRIKYGYGRVGNRLWRENVVARSLGKYFDEKYLYDEIKRLKDMERGELTSGESAITNLQFAQCWGLDETGNWKTFREDDDGDGSWDLNQNRTANKVNEIIDVTESTGPSWVTPAYSAAGNMTTVPKPADPTASFTATYDAWNRLVKLVDTTSSNTVAEYEYDAAKRRVTQRSYTGGTLLETRHLFYTEPRKWQVIEERVDSDTAPNRQFVWGFRYIDDLVMRDRDTTGNGTLDERRYALQDANWNVTSTVDTGGTVQQRMAYQAYGTPEFLTSTFASGTNSDDWETLFAGY
jgi:YD repeat-containing protein